MESEREAIIAASGSGGSARAEQSGSLRFGETTFGGDGAELRDDDGNLLFPMTCGKDDCVGSHVWMAENGTRCYCAGPNEG